MEALSKYQGLAVFALGVLVTIALWMLRAHILQVVQERTAALAPGTAVKALDERIDAHDGRLASIETALRHLPTAEQMSALSMLVADLRGEMRAIRATVEGMEKMTGAISRRVELIDEHLKRAG